jgi:hypothetical protein
MTPVRTRVGVSHRSPPPGWKPHCTGCPAGCQRLHCTASAPELTAEQRQCKGCKVVNSQHSLNGLAHPRSVARANVFHYHACSGHRGWGRLGSPGHFGPGYRWQLQAGRGPWPWDGLAGLLLLLRSRCLKQLRHRHVLTAALRLQAPKEPAHAWLRWAAAAWTPCWR